jgi:hypothetical protein
MKKSPLIYKIPMLVFFFFLVIILLNSAGCASNKIDLKDIQDAIVKGPPEIEEVVLCKNVNENYEPLDTAVSFSSGTDSIYVSIKFKDFTTEDNVSVTWTYLDIDEELITQEFSPRILKVRVTIVLT